MARNGSLSEAEPGFWSDSVPLHNEEVGLASGEGLSSLGILASGLLQVYLSRAAGGPQRGGSNSGEVWETWAGGRGA